MNRLQQIEQLEKVVTILGNLPNYPANPAAMKLYGDAYELLCNEKVRWGKDKLELMKTIEVLKEDPDATMAYGSSLADAADTTAGNLGLEIGSDLGLAIGPDSPDYKSL